MDRAALASILLAPVAALAAYQGLVTAGLLPLALFGPLYAVARVTCRTTSRARLESVRLAAVATLGAGLALIPALVFLRDGQPPEPARAAGLGLGLAAAALGTLAGLATAPPPRPLSREDKRRWAIVETLEATHARGLTLLLAAALPLAFGLALLREAPIFAVGSEAGTLPEALLGSLAVDGWLVLPGEAAGWVLAVPLSLAPLAVGFLTSPRQAAPVAGGGLLAALAAPLAVRAQLPAVVAGELRPLDLHPSPGLAAQEVLAPAGAGLVLGAGLAYVGKRALDARFHGHALWALAGAAAGLLLGGLLPAALLAAGVLAAAAVVTLRTERAPLGAALTLGTLVGAVLALAGPTAVGTALGAVVGIVAGGAAVAARGARTLVVDQESVRDPSTLLYMLVATLVAGAVAWAGAVTLGARATAFSAPHARTLAATLEAIVTSRGDLLLLWGLAAGALAQWGLGRGALVGLGFLVGPGVGLLVLLGALARAAWEHQLLDRAREGFVMRGEFGYELLRVHVLVIAVLAGEALAVAIGPAIGLG